jgi:hypothetical protein
VGGPTTIASRCWRLGRSNGQRRLRCGANGSPAESLLEDPKACSTVKRRKYQCYSVLRSIGSGPPIQVSHKGRRGNFMLGRRSPWTRTTLKGASGGASHVELGPGVDTKLHVGGVEQPSRTAAAGCAGIRRPAETPRQAPGRPRPGCRSVACARYLSHIELHTPAPSTRLHIDLNP